jgi:hypothetical protein
MPAPSARWAPASARRRYTEASTDAETAPRAEEVDPLPAIALPTPLFDLMFCLIAVLTLSLSQVFRNPPATESTAFALLLPRAPAVAGQGAGAARAQVAAVAGPSGAVTFTVGRNRVGSLPELRQRLEAMAPASVVINVDTRVRPDPLTVALRLLNVARTLGIPALLAYRQEALEGGSS